MLTFVNKSDSFVSNRQKALPVANAENNKDTNNHVSVTNFIRIIILYLNCRLLTLGGTYELVSIVINIIGLTHNSLSIGTSI